MAPNVRRRLSGIRAHAGSERDGRPRAHDPEPIVIQPGEPISAVAERLDIGASRVVAGPRLGHDIDVADLSRLLTAAAHYSAERSQRLYVQLPGRCLPVDPESPTEWSSEIVSRPRWRLLVTGGHDRITENIAIELWRHADRAYRSRSDDNPVRLFVADAPQRGRSVRTEASFEEPIDIVYTWVDSSDPGWRAMATAHLDLGKLAHDLYTPSDELRYSLRSVEVFAPWVRRIHILSNCDPPTWLKLSDRVRWIDHSEVAEPELLPLFNSGAIDTLLHRIPDLSEHFLYLNDDFLLWDSVRPATFFEWDGRSIAHLAGNSSVLYLEQLATAGTAAPSQWSRVNAARVLEDRIGVYPTRTHGHVPYALRRSAIAEMEREFAQEIGATRASRTRQPTDVSFIAFLYHHLGHARSMVSYADAPRSFITRQNYRGRGTEAALRSAPFLCFQDSRESTSDAAYQAFKRQTLEQALPLPSTAEHVDP